MRKNRRRGFGYLKQMRYICCVQTGSLALRCGAVYARDVCVMATDNNGNRRMFCVDEIVKRAKLARGFRTDSQLADYLGVSRSTLCNWIARNSIDFPRLLERMAEVDYNWLLTGRGSPVPHRLCCDGRMTCGEALQVHDAGAGEPLGERSVMLYDISAAANLRTLLDDRQQYAVGRIVIPNIPACDGAVHVSGDSMYPILKPGDIVGFRTISSFGDVVFGEMYLVSFERGGDEYLTVKYVNRSAEPDCIRLVSYNPRHDPMDLPLSAISIMAIVKFSIRMNMMM